MRTRLLTVALAVACLALAGCGGEKPANGGAEGGAWAAEASQRAGDNADLQETLHGYEGREGDAYQLCVEGVTDRLKAPATAVFSDLTDTSVTWQGDRFVAVGTVDSQNGFGALLRSDWRCEARWTGTALALDDVTIQGR